MPEVPPTLDDLPRYLDILKQQPVQGVNVHARPDPSQMLPTWVLEQTIEPMEFGSLGDPVSQFAFLAAPGGARAAKALLGRAAAPGPRFGGAFAAERGNLGPVPRNLRGEPLPESVLRNPEGQLERYYHGTDRPYPDFEVSQYGGGAGGDLYGPGIYTTNSPEVAQGYATRGWPSKAQSLVRDLQEAQQWRQQYLEQAASATTSADATWARGAAHMHEQRIRELGQELRRYAGGHPEKFQAPANVRAVYPALKKPFDIEAKPDPEVVRQLLGAHWDAEQFTSNRGVYNALATRLGKGYLEEGKAAANQLLQKHGYDGIMHLGGDETHQVAIAFSPENVYPAPHVEAITKRRSRSGGGGYQR